MMKLLAYILSVYILILTITPCKEIHQKDNTSPKNELLTNQTNSPTNNSDYCSPFCTCTYCAASVVLQNLPIQFECFPIKREHLFEYTFSYNSSEHYSIWQPPKIS